MSRNPQRHSHGFSLIEALVALAVMAIGMLGIAGVQATLRLSSDVAKQRSEAVRFAQQAIEDSRSFTLVEAMNPFTTYSDLANLNRQLVGFNATYSLTYEVIDWFATPPPLPAPGPDFPQLKALRVKVDWADRNGTTQTVELNTSVTRIMPELAATVALPSNIDANGMPTRGPQGRNPSIPSPAVNFGDGTSGYIPPNRPVGDQTAWLFNNLTGLITLCSTAVANNAGLNAPNQLNCAGGGPAWLLSGYVAFGAAANVAEALTPSGVAQAVTVSVNQTDPAAGVVSCYSAAPVPGAATVAYVCAVPVSPVALPGPPPVPANVWSGSSQVVGLVGAPVVCRYTGIAAPVPNYLHPQTYTNVNSPLVQQNFLVLPAGSACPGPLAPNLTTASP